jgi:hypothetical protein
MNTTELQSVFLKAATSAVRDWFAGQWSMHTEEIRDLTQDLWVWYLERPETRSKMAGLSFPEAVDTAKRAALQQLSRNTLDGNTFRAKNLFSSDAVKDALKGRSSNKYLLTILPIALEQLQRGDDRAEHARGYAQAIRERYEVGKIPEGKEQENLLVRAHKAITEEINVTYITTDVDRIGSRTTVFPNTRKVKGGYSDPTGDMAAQLIDRPYEFETGEDIRPHFYEETPIEDVVKGQQNTPAYDLGDDGHRYRPPAKRVVRC